MPDLTKKYFPLLFLTAVIWLVKANATAQSIMSDTTLMIKEVSITSNRFLHFSAGTKTINFDSSSTAQYADKNLADLLADESTVFIKSYGQGSLATSSLRGGSASHTAILWNGFNINSPMYGQSDLALIPVSTGDVISIQYGGTSALWGSGAVGGTIHLNNNAQFNKGLTANMNLSAGSFNDYRQQVFVELSKKRFVSGIKVFNTTAQNNFKYRNIHSAGAEETEQSNAELKNHGFLSENYFLISENQKINLMIWYQKTDRDIPPTMLQEVSRSNQTDDIYRFTSEWKYLKGMNNINVRAASLNEKLVYSDKAYDYSESSRAHIFIAEAEDKISISKLHALNFGLNNTYSKAYTPGYVHGTDQNRTALFTSYLYTSKNEKLNTTIAGRTEVLENKFVPFTFSAGADYRLIKNLWIKASVSRVYRIPTFNDLYWVPGGNPDLKSEDGYAEEAGLKFQLRNNFMTFNSDLTVFNREMENWIIWLPGLSYWSPQNIMNVWSRGIETGNKLIINYSNVKITLALSTNYVISTNIKSKAENDASKDKQLIYVPRYSGMAKAGIEFKNLGMTYRHNYTGYRFTSTDNTQYLEPYDLGSLYVSYKLPLKKASANFYVHFNNLWNEEYQLLQNRAMPKQNFNISISLEFNQPIRH